jgi:hypothetical protein
MYTGFSLAEHLWVNSAFGVILFAHARAALPVFTLELLGKQAAEGIVPAASECDGVAC